MYHITLGKWCTLWWHNTPRWVCRWQHTSVLVYFNAMSPVEGKGKGSSLDTAPLTMLDSGAEVAVDWHWL